MEDVRRTSNETPLSQLIEKLMKAYRLDGKLKELDIIQAWPEMMGIAVANRTKNSLFNYGFLCHARRTFLR